MKYKQYRQHLLVKKPGEYWNPEGSELCREVTLGEVTLGNGQTVKVSGKSLGEPLGIIHSAAPPDNSREVVNAFYVGAFLGMIICYMIVHFSK